MREFFRIVSLLIGSILTGENRYDVVLKKFSVNTKCVKRPYFRYYIGNVSCFDPNLDWHGLCLPYYNSVK